MNGRLTPAELSRSSLEAAKEPLRRLASRITLEHDWELTADLLGALERHLHLAPLLKSLSGPGLAQLRTYTAARLKRARPTARGLWALRNLAVEAARARGQFDLGDADLERFRFPFGATVRLRAG